ncbi:sensor histidine kinase [Aliikangiella coralliicola]|uniref:Signal transduction histidine kinase internal region domain-containing protein n=1 Tax=Aliikangiella coralliicola TaxID=2592383 RepID=A0A545U8X1_9GAMM|nr:histidine kinase [Aliikangiella coralliicola]TQV85909.1 hypothetical protein FLL46_18475 [Aliikangiella coralliicola]
MKILDKDLTIKIIKRLKSIFAVLSLKLIVAVFLMNSTCAFLKALYQLSVLEPNWDTFWRELYGYFKMLNLYGFSMVFAYLGLSKGPDIKMSITRIVAIGVLAFVISYPFTLLFFTWDESNLHPTLQAAIYLFATLLISAWALIVMLYIKSRESQPRFQLLKQQIAEESLSREKAEMELHLLQAQIEPHFFFNTLANLHSLIESNPDDAKKLLEQLSDYLRTSIPQFRRKFIQLGDELKMVKHYLNIQQIRFSHRLTYNISVSDELKSLPILPMSLLTLVENAIIHGIEKKSGEGNITINATSERKGLLNVSIIDSAGLLKTPKFGTGLSNLVERLEVAYESSTSLSFGKTLNDETQVNLEVPVYG